MNNIITELKDIYIWNNQITSHSLEDINVLVHKDRVWFFVVTNIGNGNYVLYTYWSIRKSDMVHIKQLFSEKIGYISVTILDINEKYVTIKSDMELKWDDFLMFIPNYYIKDWRLFWPYLDNLLSILVLNRVHYKFNLRQSIDEESKLIYSNFPKKWIAIILDVLWQDYLNKQINLDKIYSITSTSFSNDLSTIRWKDIENIGLDLKFKLEVDFIDNEITYFLLCPITNGHSEIASVKLSTIDKFEKTLNLLFDKIAWKKY